MNFIQATLTFHPEQVNRGRKSGFGVWRVAFCSNVGNPLRMRVDDLRRFGDPQYLRMMVARPYPKGAIVNPLRLALDHNRHAAEERARMESIVREHRRRLYRPAYHSAHIKEAQL